MTWSILARDESGRFGVAIASRFFAVGALCIQTRRGVGAVSTQALMNPLYAPAALDALERGQSAQQVVDQLTAADAGRDQRQLHVLPAVGAGAAHTGATCVDWCGHQVHPNFSVAGNMLAGAAVVQATVDAFLAAHASPLPLRLLVAMQAGEAVGGDKRGKQSAALRIHGHEDYVELDMRVDDHADPLTELARLYQVSLDRFVPFATCLAGRNSPAGITHRAEIDARIAAFQVQRQNGNRTA